MELRAALYAAQRAEASDALARGEDCECTRYCWQDGRLRQSWSRRRAMAIELRYQGALGFASSSDLGRPAIEAAGKRAFEMAARLAGVGLAPANWPPRCAEARTQAVLLEATPKKSKTALTHEALVQALAARLEQGRGLRHSRVVLHTRQCRRDLVSLSGAELSEEWCEQQVELMVLGEGASSRRHWQYAARNNAPLDEQALLSEASALVAECEALQDAEPLPRLCTTAVLDAELVAVVLFETLGALLLPFDPAALPEAGSRIASGQVSLWVDSSDSEVLCARSFDDAGFASCRRDLLRDGYYVATLQEQAEGQLFAERPSEMPRPMISNLLMQGGILSHQELLSSCAQGVLLKGARRWSLDASRRRMLIEAEFGQELAAGSLGRIWRNPMLSLDLYEFWRSCHGLSQQRKQVPMPLNAPAQSCVVAPMALFDDCQLGSQCDGLGLVDG